MMGYDVRKIPTGVADFDAIIDGGLPDGSVVLLLGDVGAGHQEFVYTSAFKIAMVKEHPETGDYFLGSLCDFSNLPDKICYVTFSRSKDDILREIATSFNSEFFGPLSRKIKFKDFSSTYFKKSIVPTGWTEPDGKKGLFSSGPKEDVLESLVNFLDENAHNSMVIIDSLTDLVVSNLVEFKELVNVLKGIQRACKEWKGIVYLLLAKDILGKRDELMIIDSVDGVFIFEWSKYHRTSKRQRYMFIEKFMSLLPHLEDERTARFPTQVSAGGGLRVINMDVIA
jgi:KaiC/GvpD/RAD55 family RecA-like ATPase